MNNQVDERFQYEYLSQAYFDISLNQSIKCQKIIDTWNEGY